MIFIWLIGFYILMGIGVYFFQEKLIFYPEKLPNDFKFNFHIKFEEHFIKMDDGAELNALRFKSENSKGLILYFHGNAGSLRRWGEVVDPFVDLGYDVLIMDFRGYGKSSGKRSHKAMLSDADRLYEFALNFVEEKNLILFGRSLGCSFASYLAGKNDPSKLILESPFYSMGDMARRVMPIFPQSIFLRFNFNNYKSLIGANCPIYIFHGKEDEIVPLESGQKLFQKLDSDQSQLFAIEGGGHNNLAGFDEYWIEMSKILGSE